MVDSAFIQFVGYSGLTVFGEDDISVVSQETLSKVRDRDQIAINFLGVKFLFVPLIELGSTNSPLPVRG